MALGAGLEDVLAVPFSDKLRTQFGQEITCIPSKGSREGTLFFAYSTRDRDPLPSRYDTETGIGQTDAETG